MLSYVVLSKEVRRALKFACSPKPSPDPALTTKSTLTSVRGLGLREVEGLRGSGERQEALGVCSLAPLFLRPYVLSWKKEGAVQW